MMSASSIVVVIHETHQCMLTAPACELAVVKLRSSLVDCVAYLLARLGRVATNGVVAKAVSGMR